MPHLPLNIDMHGRTALVVGGGPVALRKVRALRNAGARVDVVALSLDPDLVDQWTSIGASVKLAAFEPDALEGVFLAVAATDDALVNSRIAMAARQRGIMVAVADAPDSGDCTFPALLRRGELEIAISTGGRCPAFAVLVRDRIARLIGDEYGDALEQLALAREKLLTEGNGSTYNKKIVRSLARRLIEELSNNKDAV